jgi:hypothetical protein
VRRSPHRLFTSEEMLVDKKAKTPKKPKQNKPKGDKTSKTQ